MPNSLTFLALGFMGGYIKGGQKNQSYTSDSPKENS
jgi:hypothetical protein